VETVTPILKATWLGESPLRKSRAASAGLPTDFGPQSVRAVATQKVLDYLAVVPRFRATTGFGGEATGPARKDAHLNSRAGFS